MQRWLLPVAALLLWLVLAVQAWLAPVLLDDWFQLRYWRDHAYSLGALAAYWWHNYFHYNPRIGDVLLAAIDGSRVVHLVLSPLVEIAALVVAFVVAFGRWPRRDVRDVQLLLFMQVMIWLVIPIPGILYFYRPFATNYVWAFTLTLALFVPYRLARDGSSLRTWAIPPMFVLGWAAGMCNEHTGPTAILALACLVYVAWQRGQLRAWMVGGLAGLCTGYPMLFFAPGQRLRYMGLATRETPAHLLAERGFIGCLHIALEFVWEARLGILIAVAALVRYAVVQRGWPRVSRQARITSALLALAALTIVATLFASPMTTDRVLYAPGVLLVAAAAPFAEHVFRERSVRTLVTAACAVLFAFHATRFISVYAAVKAENDDRIARLEAHRPLPAYEHADRTRWHLGDDFALYPWLQAYVETELYDLGPARYRVARTFDPPLAKRPRIADVPTYRQWTQSVFTRARVLVQLGPISGHRLTRFAIGALGLPIARRVLVTEWTPATGWQTIVGAPYDDPRGHFVRIDRATLPPRPLAMYMLGCGAVQPVDALDDAAGVLLPVDETVCRGVFTALACERDRCWIAGYY